MKTAPTQAKSSRQTSDDLRHCKNDMIASKCSRQSNHRRNDGTQDQSPSHGERDLSGPKGRAAGGDGNKRRAEHTGAAVESKNAGINRHEERQGINCQREDQPAEQTDANGVEKKSKSEHGGGSMCKEVTVAPSTTTAAQFWT
jgi:hypothetical protein